MISLSDLFIKYLMDQFIPSDYFLLHILLICSTIK